MSSNKKLTNKDIDNRLISSNNPIKRISNYINATTKITWECQVGHYWEATPNSIKQGSGCPVCYGNVKYTANDIDNKIHNRNISRVGEYINYDTLLEWVCDNCGNHWKATPNNIISKNSGCPKCSQEASGKRKSIGQKDRVLDILQLKNLQLQHEYTRIVDKHKIKCTTCDYAWGVRLNDIINNDHGCPSCSGSLKQTNEDVDRRLSIRNDGIIRIGNYVNATTKITWNCEFGHQWDAVPDSVLNAGTGCPVCNNKGLYNNSYIRLNKGDLKVLATLYFLRFLPKDGTKSFVKIGITKNNINKRFCGYNKKYKIIQLLTYKKTLFECIGIEQDIIYNMRAHQFIPNEKFDGRTECFVDSPEVEHKIKQLLENVI